MSQKPDHQAVADPDHGIGDQPAADRAHRGAAAAHVARPEADIAEPQRLLLDSPEAVRAFWESGGQADPGLSADRRRLLQHAANKYVDVRLSDNGGLVLARQLRSGPWRVLDFRARPTFGGEVATLTRARDLARRLERDLVDADGLALDWNNPDEDQRYVWRSARGEVFEAAAERIMREHQIACDTASGKRGQQGRTTVGDAAAVRSYWARGGRADPGDVSPRQWEQNRGHMRWMADNVQDLKVSPGGQFMLVRVRKGLPWDVTTIDGTCVHKSVPSEKQAREFAARIERELVDAAGNRLDFNAPDFLTRAKTFRTRGGESAAEAMARIITGGPEPASACPPIEAQPPGGGFPTVHALRAHLREAPGETDAARRVFLARLANDPTLELSSTGRLAIVKGKERGSGWQVYAPWQARLVSLGATLKSKAEARTAATILEAITNADGAPVPWASPTLLADMKNWRDADGRTLHQATLAALGQHDIDRGRPDSAIARGFRSAEESRQRTRALQERATAGGYRIGDVADLVAGDEIELETTVTDTRRPGALGGWTNQDLLDGDDPPTEPFATLTIRGRLRGEPDLRHAAERGVTWSFEPPATWHTEDGRSGPLRQGTFRTPEHQRRVLLRRDDETERVLPTAEGLTSIGAAYDLPAPSVQRMVEELSGAFADRLPVDARRRFRRLRALPDAALDTLITDIRTYLDVRPQAVEVINRWRIGNPAGNDSLMDGVFAADLTAIAAERTRRSLPPPDPRYLAGADVARRLRDGEPVDLTALDGDLLRGAADYAASTRRQWADYLLSSLPDRDERASRWNLAVQALTAEQARRDRG
ncbi:hypothetical protein [Nonomuraea sp. NPDC049695]|uniref:hypothetical protein n=1 Tax=Nonomuraea sp. NPDC049695 TaxID=3154734 RepID=UPI00342D33A2